MRKFLLTASILMISASAYAAPSMQVAANDTPLAPPTAESTVAPAQAAEPAAAPEPAKTAEPAAAPAPTAETKPVEATKPKQHARRRDRESDEHKARRIAAKYGVYW